MIIENYLIESNINKNSSNAIFYDTFPRFRWYSYKEGFSSTLVEEAIKTVNINENDYILDPFNGNGTVTLTSSINKINSIGIEVNPFVAFMSSVKLENLKSKRILKDIDNVLLKSKKGKSSKLELFSTFTEKTGKEKWLFNSEVLNSFESGWQSINNLSLKKKKLFRLALIGAAMDNCNAVKDGKCLKYRNNWEKRNFDNDSFLDALEKRLKIILEDLEKLYIPKKATIINDDARKIIKELPFKFKLCITSPPYLNSFDYTDIYRPELFLGKFIKSNKELRELRYRTLRSHVEISLPKPKSNYFGEIYKDIEDKLNRSKELWSNQIPIMVKSYFEDMKNILKNLELKAERNSQLWIIIGNSVYVGFEIPVDLILAEIGTRNGWDLDRIEVLRYIYRRKTKYNGNINKVRESLIVFRKK